VLKDWFPVHRNYVVIITRCAFLRPARTLPLPLLSPRVRGKLPLFTELPRRLSTPPIARVSWDGAFNGIPHGSTALLAL
jgi:hypothetical protein